MNLDVHISLAYLDTPSLQRIGESLMRTKGERVPGWYIRAYSNEGYDNILKYTLLPTEAVKAIAHAIDLYLPRSPGIPLLGDAIVAHEDQAARLRQEHIERLKARIESDRRMLDALTNELSPANMDSSTATKEA